jgi:diguanylate cyclase (GGDEF)-like protein
VRSLVKSTSLITRIAVAATLSLALFAVGTVVIIKTDIERSIYAATDARVQVGQNTLWDLVRAKGKPSLVRGTLRLGNWVANGDNSLVDHLRKLTGADATLFAVIAGVPTRIATTIRKADGSRNVGTVLKGPARDAFDAGRSFAGVSPVAGRDFLNRYDALRDPSGKVIGVVYSGIPLTSMYEAVSQMMRFVIIGTAVVLLFCLTLLYEVTRPLRLAFADVVRMAQGLAAGEVDQKSNPHASDGLGEMSVAFADMIRYQQRMAGVADAIADGDFSDAVTPVSQRDRLGVAFASMSRNLKRLMDELERSALTDSLTQLGNRRAFDQRLSSELSRVARRGGTLSLAVVDIDHFKSANDGYGHQHGDVLLVKLATALRHVREEDVAFRIGGDEFAVILSDSTVDQAKFALERIREEAEAGLLGTTVTIGVSTSPAGLVDSDALQRQADAALYVGKQRGRNIVVSFDDAQSRGAVPQQMNVHAVTRLIAERGLQIYFQPIWDLQRSAILGFEALARPAAKYGLSGPQEAFDVAAKIGRAHDLDRVCRDATIARAKDLPAGTLLFLNLSPETLVRGVLEPEAFAAALATVGVTPDRTVLEITERFEGPPEAVIAAAASLQRFGFKLALDDTGAGNAGLGYLVRLGVDFVKIDGAIVASSARDLGARGVIAAIVAFAATTGAYVIAEGIEDQTMLDAVRGTDVPEGTAAGHVRGVQGYYLGRPDSEFELAEQSTIASVLRRRTLAVPIVSARS